MTIRRLAFGFVLLACASMAAAAVTPANPAEKAVLQAVQSGRPADVSGMSDRTVRLAFLNEIGRKSQDPIEIVGAIFPDTVDHLNVPGGLELRACEFPNGLHLLDARLGNLIMTDCTLSEAALVSSHISGSFVVANGSLKKLSISGGTIGDWLDISNGAEPILRLSQLNVPHVSVSRPYQLDVDACEFTSLSLDSHNWPNGSAPVDMIRIQNTSAKYVAFRNLAVHQFIYYRSKVDGLLTLFQFDAADLLDLSSSSIAELSWTRLNPGWARSVALDGTQFKTIHIDSPSQSSHPYNERLHRNVLDFLTAAGYSAPAFTAYQQSLEDRGMTAEANETAFTMHEKWRTTQYDCTNVSRAHCLWSSAVRTPLVAFDLVQQYGFGLGRSVTAPLLWSAVFVICGFVVFRKQEWMEPRSDKVPAPFSNSWYSLELFLPVVDLGVAKDWRPAPKPRWRSTYARIHQLAGWILIPVAIAALTGGLKK